MTESCLSFKLKSSAELSTCLCMKCLWKNICGKEGKKQRENLVSAGLLPLLLLESSLEKTERDGEKGTDWMSWGENAAWARVLHISADLWLKVSRGGCGEHQELVLILHTAFTSAITSDGHLVEQNFDLCRNRNSLQSLTCFFFLDFIRHSWEKEMSISSSGSMKLLFSQIT